VPARGTVTGDLTSELETTREPLTGVVLVGAKVKVTGKLALGGSVSGVFADEKVKPWPEIRSFSKLTGSSLTLVTCKV
jgi:hypothetical protein